VPPSTATQQRCRGPAAPAFGAVNRTSPVATGCPTTVPVAALVAALQHPVQLATSKPVPAYPQSAGMQTRAGNQHPVKSAAAATPAAAAAAAAAAEAEAAGHGAAYAAGGHHPEAGQSTAAGQQLPTSQQGDQQRQDYAPPPAKVKAVLYESVDDYDHAGGLQFVDPLDAQLDAIAGSNVYQHMKRGPD
jgi:hypothetical protein